MRRGGFFRAHGVTGGLAFIRLATTALTAFLYITAKLFITTPLSPGTGDLDRVSAQLSISWWDFSVLYLCIAFYAACTRDPTIPQNDHAARLWRPFTISTTPSNVSSLTSAERVSLVRQHLTDALLSADSASALGLHMSEGIRYCRQCNLFKRPRTHHCRACATCVSNMDHHCPWLSGCVGRRNHLQFVQFLGAVVVSCGHLTWIAGGRMRDLVWVVGVDDWVVPAFVTVNCIAAAMTTFAVTVLLIYQLYNALNGNTTVEAFHRDRAERRAAKRTHPYGVFPYDLDDFARNLVTSWHLQSLLVAFYPLARLSEGPTQAETISQEFDPVIGWPPGIFDDYLPEDEAQMASGDDEDVHQDGIRYLPRLTGSGARRRGGIDTPTNNGMVSMDDLLGNTNPATGSSDDSDDDTDTNDDHARADWQFGMGSDTLASAGVASRKVYETRNLADNITNPGDDLQQKYTVADLLLGIQPSTL
ncbi:Palmitoyltransferase [Savitreella phatthalungensis]